jgi:hypothetical protein
LFTADSYDEYVDSQFQLVASGLHLQFDTCGGTTTVTNLQQLTTPC